MYFIFFRSFTHTADYPHLPIIAYGKKKSQQITRTGGWITVNSPTDQLADANSPTYKIEWRRRRVGRQSNTTY